MSGKFQLLHCDDITGSDSTVYMKRWILVGCPWFSIRVHKFLRSDNDVLHDHPWSFLTVILKGGYHEERYVHDLDPGQAICHCGEYCNQHTQLDNHAPVTNPEITDEWYGPGIVRFVRAEVRHRVRLRNRWIRWEGGARLAPAPCWTLVFTGPARRPWGFWCPDGWVPWRHFLGVMKGICS